MENKKSPFLIAMGAVAAVAVIGYFILVMPAKAEAAKKETDISKKLTTINKDLTTLPGDPNVEAWSKNAEELKKRYREQLVELQQYDAALGEWFDGLDDSTTFAVFMNTYDDQRAKLQEELLEKGIALGSPSQGAETNQPGFNWIHRADIDKGVKTNEDERQAKEMLQKRYNICRAIVNALTDGYTKTSDRPSRRLLDVTFLEKFKFLPAGVGVNPDAGKTFDIVIEPKRYAGFVGIGSGVFAEQMLPPNGDKPVVTEASADGAAPATPPPSVPDVYLGRTITFGFAVVMEYQQVPELIHKLLNSKVEPKLNLSIVGLNVFVPVPNPAEKKEIKVLQAGGPTEAELQAEADRKTEACPPALIHAYVTCQVFDLDPSAIPAGLKP